MAQKPQSAKEGRSGGAIATDRDASSELSTRLPAWPDVRVRTKWNGASFLLHGKVFAFTRGEDLVLKLPGATIHALVSSGGASFLKMGARTMTEWALVECWASREQKSIRELLKDALEFVMSSHKGR